MAKATPPPPSLLPPLCAKAAPRHQQTSAQAVHEPARAELWKQAFQGRCEAWLDTHAQKVLRILSGLYGVLRPLDLMQPYRLEMGTSLTTDRGDSLYSFWGDRITDQLNADIAESPGANVLVNLASNEYFGSVKPDRIDARIMTPTFLDSKNGGPYKIVSFFAKRARGAMSGWIIRERIKSAKTLVEFDGMGYRYDAERSTADEPVFIREDGAMG